MVPAAALFALLLTGGCGGAQDPLGADIREALEVTKSSPEDWEDSPERAYDPQVILRRAEALFQRRDYVEAELEYRHFLELHPLHEWADYTQLKLALSNFRQFKSVDRDPGPVRKAIREFDRFLSLYPDSKYVEEARKGIAESREWIGEHELYVGRFYYKTKAYPAAISRLEGLLNDYPGHPGEPEALFILGRSHEADGDAERAAATLNNLISSHPESEFNEKARRILARL
ncbi:MAG TPA: outer membrane protein assembly factor BamD [Nitrospiria bacterium]